ncbi:MAG: hypothetical protein KDC61_02520, partial [Saprospiraceae bacterium]|nr:hypothetical protein [Saprospiraceae bacterium]
MFLANVEKDRTDKNKTFCFTIKNIRFTFSLLYFSSLQLKSFAMKMQKNAISWFEIPVGDFERA